MGGGSKNLKEGSQKRIKGEESRHNRDNIRKGERKLGDSWRSIIRMFYFVFKMGYIKACFHLIETKCL